MSGDDFLLRMFKNMIEFSGLEESLDPLETLTTSV